MKYKLETIFQELDIKGVSLDSRNIQQNDAFFAIKGEKFNGNEYIDAALAAGASVAFTDDKSQLRDNVLYIENARKALTIASAIIYPSLPKNIIAVTGTNGKSSVVSYVHQILNLLGKTTASMGTLGIESNTKLPNNSFSQASLTTSDAISFRKNLHILSQNNIENVAFEASSHGLDQNRLGDVKATSAAFTSFSQDHLEYHHTMENYLNTKLTLFTENLKSGSEAVINSEIMNFNIIKNFLETNKIAYISVGLKGDLKIINSTQSISGQHIFCEFENNKYEFETNIIGSFQATNILIAAKLVNNLNIDFNKIISILPKLEAVSGRLQRITKLKSDFHVFVDYAHTPDALEKSLLELKNIKNKSSGKLYVIFGCGGNRDTSKRPIMGKIASSIADYTIITDDNPRTEDPAKIRREVASGATNYEEIGDRKQAISDIIALLKKDDILLIAGKGHEDYQILGNKTIKLSDIAIARQCLDNN